MVEEISVEHFLKVRSARAPKFLADGRSIVFLGDDSGSSQIWRLELDGADRSARQLTFHDSAVSRIEPSPISQSLIYAMDQDGDERHQFYFLEEGASAARPLTAAPKVMHNWGGWSADASAIAFTANDRNPALFDAFVLDVASGQRRRVAECDGWFTVEGPSHDMGRLILLETIGSADQRLHLMDLETGQRRRLTPEGDVASYENCRWAGDGRTFYGLTNQGRDFLGLARFDAEDGGVEWLHTPDHDVEAFELSKDGKKVALVTNTDGYSQLTIYDLASRQIRSAKGLPVGVIAGQDWAPDGTAILFVLEGARRNADLWLWDLESDSVTRLTHSERAGLSAEQWIEPERVHCRSFDGRDIPAFFYRPQTDRPAEGYPAIIVVHGGPASQFRPTFSPELQFFLAKGYAVLAPNVRGSTGYGAAYAALDDVGLRMDSVRDLKHQRIWLGDREEIDADRIAVFGGSYGGFMVLAAITEYPDLWKAAVEFFGIANFQTFLERTGPWRRRHRAMEYGDPIKDAELLRSISPIHKVDRIRVPLFVAQGLTDPRVPPHESELIVKALRDRAQPVEYLTIDDEGHGFVKLKNQIRVFAEMAAFLDRYL